MDEQERQLYDECCQLIDKNNHLALSELVAGIGSEVISTTLLVKMTHTLSRQGLVEMASSLLLSQPTDWADPKYFRSVAFVLKYMPRNTRTRLKLTRMLREASKGGETIEPRSSRFRFIKQATQDHFGSITVRASSDVDAIHVQSLQAEEHSFSTLLNTPIQPTAYEYENVFVDAVGQIWTPSGQIIRNRGHELATLDPSSVLTVNLGFYSIFTTRGIYHWLVDRLPLYSCIADSDSAAEIRLLMRAGGPKFQQELLSVVGFAPSRVVEVSDQPVFVERLVVANVGFRGMVGWSHLSSVYGRISHYADLASKADNPPDKIYISRSDAKRRPMLNEVEIERGMVDRGFTVCSLSGMAIEQQIALFQHAKVIAGPHGAGLSHIIFAQPGTKVIEILPIMLGSYNLRFNYARLSVLRQLDYHAWMEPQSVQASSWKTNCEEFFDYFDQIV